MIALRRLCVVLILVLLLSPGPRSVVAQPPGTEVAGRLARVIDGDTFEVERPDGKTITVRLFGVDAPESDQPFGAEATRAVQRYAGDSRVRLSVRETGAYGRTIGRIHVQGTSLVQLQLVRCASGLWTDVVRPYRNVGDWNDGRLPSTKDRLKLH